MTGEQIRRKLRDGSRNTHVYYRCANNHPPEDHPRVRWREADVEAAILAEFETMRLPTPEAADFFRDLLAVACDDTAAVAAECRRRLSKRKTELANMQDRLLNGYLEGAIDEATFTAKSAELKARLEEVEKGMDEAGVDDPLLRDRALGLFDLSQHLVDIWHGSNWNRRREVLECVSLNRALSDVSLVLTKRKPFDVLAERLSSRFGRGDWI